MEKRAGGRGAMTDCRTERAPAGSALPLMAASALRAIVAAEASVLRETEHLDSLTAVSGPCLSAPLVVTSLCDQSGPAPNVIRLNGRRTLVGLAVLCLTGSAAAVAQVVTAGPASAHTGTVHGTAVCVDNGDRVVTWEGTTTNVPGSGAAMSPLSRSVG